MILLGNNHPINTYAPDFELRGSDRQIHHLARYLEKFQAVGIVFISECSPQVLSDIERLKKIQDSFQSRGFTLVGIKPNDSRRNHARNFYNLQIFAISYQLNFPYLWDSTQDVASSFGVQETPQAFVVDRNGIIRYAGAIEGIEAAVIPLL